MPTVIIFLKVNYDQFCLNTISPANDDELHELRGELCLHELRQSD
jgi:hypothetical protein